MDYEKKYKEALERARQFSEKPYLEDSAGIVEYIFPELKESEDERIKKMLRDVISQWRTGNQAWCSDVKLIDATLAWLEKQVHVDEDDLDFAKRLNELRKVQRERNLDELIEMRWSALKDAEKLTKEMFTMQAKFFFEVGYEKQGEQKPAYKIEPKFKQGDIIKEKDTGNLFYVNSIEEFGYTLHYKDCIAKGCTTDFKYEDDYELVEQEPVDKVEPKFYKGEWLCENEPNNYARFIQILETVNVQGKERYRISRDIHNDENIVEFNFVEKYYHKFDIKDAKDGDVLFTSSTASHETFTFKSIDKNGNAECYFTYDSEDGFREGKYHFIGRATSCKPATKEQRDLLFQKMYEAGYEWDAEKKELKKIEQKSSWSEEDEEIIRSLLDIIYECHSYGKCALKLNEYSKLYNWLKSLKVRYTWKPSDEQMRVLDLAIRCGINRGTTEETTLVSLFNDLKKLREE